MGTTRLGQTSQCTGARSSAITKVQLRWFLLPSEVILVEFPDIYAPDSHTEIEDC